jgi:hypothetical protein
MKKLIAILVSGLFVTVAAAQTASPGTGMKAVAETKKLRAGTELDAKHAEDMKKAKQARAKKAKKGAQKSVKKGIQAGADLKQEQTAGAGKAVAKKSAKEGIKAGAALKQEKTSGAGRKAAKKGVKKKIEAAASAKQQGGGVK